MMGCYLDRQTPLSMMQELPFMNSDSSLARYTARGTEQKIPAIVSHLVTECFFLV